MSFCVLSSSPSLFPYPALRSAAPPQVSNEQALLSAVARQYPNAEVHVYHGTEGALDTVHLFRRATIVMGMHGAGLSHLIFSDPGTAVIEFLFMSAPPLMFWHAASALHQRYIMVPLPQSWWLQPSVEVPVQDVLDALAIATRAPSNCPAGAAPMTSSVRQIPGAAITAPGGLCLCDSRHRPKFIGS